MFGYYENILYLFLVDQSVSTSVEDSSVSNGGDETVRNRAEFLKKMQAKKNPKSSSSKRYTYFLYGVEFLVAESYLLTARGSI